MVLVINYQLKDFFINIYHFCNHAIYSEKIHDSGENWNDRWWSNRWGETMTTISIGYEFELPVYNSKK